MSRGSAGNAVDEAGQRLLVDRSEGHQAVAKPLARLAAALQRPGHVCFRDPVGPDQQITESHAKNL